jgi:hypothetical protein
MPMPSTGFSPSWRDKMRQLLQEDLDDLHNQPNSRSIASYDNSSDEVAMIEYAHNSQIGMRDSETS